MSEYIHILKSKLETQTELLRAASLPVDNINVPVYDDTFTTWSVDNQFNLIAYSAGYARWLSSALHTFSYKGLRTSNIETLLKPHYENVLDGQEVSLEIKVKTDQGKRWESLILRPVYNNQQIIAIAGEGYDITKYKKKYNQLKAAKKAAEKSLKVKERFLAYISHEIKTPLNGMLGTIHLIDGKYLKDTDKQYFQTLKGSAKILMNIVDNLLDISTVKAGKMTLNKEVINLKQFFINLQSLYELEAYRNNLNLSFHIDEGVPDNILADEVKLTQIYSNLISNAIKFSPQQGTIDVTISVEETDKQGNIRLKGAVIDSGVGIDKKDKKRIFKRFTKLNAQSKSFKSTGLGLFITKQLIKIMGGDIGVTSIKDQGAHFYFTFQTMATTPPDDFYQAKTNTVFFANQPKVLIVDDNKTNLLIAEAQLKKAGSLVETADSGKKALKKVSKTDFNVIFMDILMPNKDGVETAKAIRRINKQSNVPIIAMTAYNLPGDREKYLSQGFNDYMTKPIRGENLITMTATWAGIDYTPSISSEDKIIPKINVSLNKKTIKTLMQYGGREFIINTLDEFEKECKDEIIKLKRCSAFEHQEQILFTLHQLKGSAGTIGADNLAYWAEFMEGEVKKKKYHTFEGNLRIFESFHQDFKIALAKL